jgi:sodium transport system permease protein
MIGERGAALRAAWAVFVKELRDALRDRRSLMVVLVSSVAMGPLVLLLLSSLVSGAERRAEAREVLEQGLDHAPSLRNWFERQTYTVLPAPPDYERQLRDSKLGDPVVVVSADFETELAAGRQPLVEVLGSSANRRAQAGVGRVVAALRDPNPVLYGALNAALDTTAGERERGSLEPLLMNPAPRAALVAGKWAAVSAVGMLIAVLSCLSFLPGQWLLRSESLAAMFRFGPGEAAAFLAVLLPLAGALAALLMAIAIRCRSFKEAQANATVVVLAVSLLPLLTAFNQEGEAPWHLWVPALAQVTLMTRVLKGEAIGAPDMAVPLLVCVLLTAAGVAYVARALRRGVFA